MSPSPRSRSPSRSPEERRDAEMRAQQSASPPREKDPARSASSRTPPQQRSPSRSQSPSPPRRRSRSPSDTSLHSPSRSPSPSRSLSRSPPPRSVASPRRRDASFSPSAARSSGRDRQPAGPCVKVTGLTKMVTRSHVEEIFGYYGQVKSCTLPLYTRSQESKGNAWLLFASTSNAEKAIEHMDKGQIDGAVVRVDFGRFPQPEPQRDYRDERYRLDGRGGGRNGRTNREDVGLRGDRYKATASRYPPREDYDARYPPPHLARTQGNGYGRRSPSPGRGRSQSPPPRKLGRKRSLSRSLSRNRDGPRRQRDESMSPSPSRSPSYSPRRRRSRSRSRDSRSPRRSRSRSRSFTPKRTTEKDTGRTRSRTPSRSRSQSLDRHEADARRDRMSLSPANPQGRP